MGATDRGPDTHPDPPVPLAVAPLAALPRVPRPVPTSGLLLPAFPLPRRVAPPVGPHLRLPAPRRAPWPAAFVLALPVPLPVPAAARALRRHRAGTGAVDRGRAPGVRAAAAGSEGAHEDAAAGVHGGGGADDRAQHRDHRGHHARALLGPAWPLLSHSGSGGTWISTAPSSTWVILCILGRVACSCHCSSWCSLVRSLAILNLFTG
ncbi:hypothetical protein VPH35_021980 [Triticum aestivum]